MQTEINQLLQDVQKEMSAERFDLGLQRIDEYSGILSGCLLVLKGICIQMVDSTKYSLYDAKTCFLSALAEDPSYSEALLELAWFEFNIESNGEKALSLFEQARKQLDPLLKEAVKGAASVLAEVESKGKAIRYIESADLSESAKNEIINVVKHS